MATISEREITQRINDANADAKALLAMFHSSELDISEAVDALIRAARDKRNASSAEPKPASTDQGRTRRLYPPAAPEDASATAVEFEVLYGPADRTVHAGPGLTLDRVIAKVTELLLKWEPSPEAFDVAIYRGDQPALAAAIRFRDGQYKVLRLERWMYTHGADHHDEPWTFSEDDGEIVGGTNPYTACAVSPPSEATSEDDDQVETDDDDSGPAAEPEPAPRKKDLYATDPYYRSCMDFHLGWHHHRDLIEDRDNLDHSDFSDQAREAIDAAIEKRLEETILAGVRLVKAVAKGQDWGREGFAFYRHPTED